jgi:hypothetical protein
VTYGAGGYLTTAYMKPNAKTEIVGLEFGYLI